jgi:hypothetical protein
MKRFLVTGCPRSGTRYASVLFRRLGVRMSQEAVFGINQGLYGKPPDWGEWEGESSWMAVPFLPLDDTVVLHQVRHPLDFVRSVCGFGFLSNRSAEFIYPKVVGRHAPEVYAHPTQPERGAAMWRIWNARAEAHAVITYRVEDLDTALLMRLCGLIELDISDEQAAQAFEGLSKTTNQRNRDESVRWEDIQPIAGEAAARYGY